MTATTHAILKSDRRGRLRYSTEQKLSLILDTMLAGKSHGARAAAVKGFEQRLLLGGRIAETPVFASADDRGVGGFEMG